MILNFGWFKGRLDPALLSRHLSSVREIPGLQQIQVRDDFNSWPAVLLAKALPSDEDLTRFQGAIRDLLAAIAAAP